MLTCFVSRNCLVNINDSYAITTKLFELAHSNPPINRLLAEAEPIMQELSSDLQQSYHLTIYNQGRQVVIAKVGQPERHGFQPSVGVGISTCWSPPRAECFWRSEDPATTQLRIREAARRAEIGQSDPADLHLGSTGVLLGLQPAVSSRIMAYE